MENNFLEILNGVKLYEPDGENGLKEVSIPIEYFEGHKIIEEAIKNLSKKYNKNKKIFKDAKLVSLKIMNDKDGNVFVQFEYSSDNSSKKLLVHLCTTKVNKYGFKIKLESFLQEINKILLQKRNEIIKSDNMNNEQFAKGEISDTEWLKKKQVIVDTILDFEIDPDKFMIEQAEGLKEKISRVNARKGKLDKIYVVMAHDDARGRRVPSGRNSREKVNDGIPFETRAQLLSELSEGKEFAVHGIDERDELYRAFVIDNKQEGVIIVMEPIDGEKTTFITYAKKSELEDRKKVLSARKSQSTPEEDIVREVMGKKQSEKVKDTRIVLMYHRGEEAYISNLRFIATGKGKVHSELVKRREAMIK